MSQQAVIKLALIGECMAELTQIITVDNDQKNTQAMRLGYGGDVMNTAIYCKRLLQNSAQISFVSVMGKDKLSEDMMALWHEEGLDLSTCSTLAAKSVGLYMVHNRADGERTFQYWRNDSAAKYLMQTPQSAQIFKTLAEYDAVYLSGISIAILPESDRQIMLDRLKMLKTAGVTIIFDSNYRPLLWTSLEQTRACFKALYQLSDLLLVTFEDEQAVWGDEDTHETMRRLSKSSQAELIVKSGAQGCYYFNTLQQAQDIQHIPTQVVSNVIDTTAAGDSFNAGFLARWLAHKPVTECATLGNVLAGQVIQQKGAIVPLDISAINKAVNATAAE